MSAFYCKLIYRNRITVLKPQIFKNFIFSQICLFQCLEYKIWIKYISRVNISILQECNDPFIK